MQAAELDAGGHAGGGVAISEIDQRQTLVDRAQDARIAFAVITEQPGEGAAVERTAAVASAGHGGEAHRGIGIGEAQAGDSGKRSLALGTGYVERGEGRFGQRRTKRGALQRIEGHTVTVAQVGHQNDAAVE